MMGVYLIYSVLDSPDEHVYPTSSSEAESISFIMPPYKKGRRSSCINKIWYVLVHLHPMKTAWMELNGLNNSMNQQMNYQIKY
ncbi:hypothetical protein J6590_076928 [Homalodisca vitripennis]|nr:hypothetical protein J6590_076928 [Homalodisca vitripennis]